MHKQLSSVGALVALHFVNVAFAQVQGPSSSQTPYILPVAPGVQTVSILTVGDTVTQGSQSYTMVGIPDGLGAYATNGGRFTVLMNHELGATAGAVHAHGQAGAFVSKWEIRRSDLSVRRGADLIQNVNVVNGTSALGRLCSADLAHRVAFFPLGFQLAPQIFLSGEEVGAEGRVFAHVASGPQAGESFELTSLGRLSFENAVARPFPSLQTIVGLTDDSTPGQVYFYIGTKQLLQSNVLRRAGLSGGSLYGVRVPNVAAEDRTNGIGTETRFELASLGDVSGKTGAQIQTDSVAAGVTEFLRPEDSVWDPLHPRDFYFVTTDRFQNATQEGRSRLWRLRFDSVSFPQNGGTITMLLDGTEGQQMMDNLTIDRRGHLLIQEDPGAQDHLARIWQYTISTDQLKLIAEHDASRFAPGAANFLTRDEESSGIVDASDVIGDGWFLLDCQAHYALDSTLVEGGQLLALYNPDSDSSCSH